MEEREMTKNEEIIKAELAEFFARIDALNGDPLPTEEAARG
jgi:hypothetical protein